MPMVSDKEFVCRLVQLFKLKGVKHIVFSPGSRNAPLIISFNGDPFFKCIVVPDERSAGFFALGMAQFLQEPVAVCCTSGTAPLNYAPSLAEAYYQKVPLIALTADRPKEWIDQGAGQSMRQENIFQNYIKFSAQLIGETNDPDLLWYNDRLISEAIDKSMLPAMGPVHINVPLREPLYGKAESHQFQVPKPIQFHQPKSTLAESSIDSLQDDWKTHTKKLLILGQSKKNKVRTDLIDKLIARNDVLVIAENIANCNAISLAKIMAAAAANVEDFVPDLLITTGDAIVNKAVKKIFANAKLQSHWHIDHAGAYKDVFQSLSDILPIAELDFLQMISSWEHAEGAAYKKMGNQLIVGAHLKHDQFMKELAWSDLKAFDLIMSQLPENSALHLSNSSPIRYAQFFPLNENIEVCSNRGVSGIDGCSSTAVGYAHASNIPTCLITGDVAFFYDSNAFWNEYIHPKLKIIVINNGGGGIFRMIDGPDTTDQLETYFESHHQASVEGVAKTYGLSYVKATDEEGLKKELNNIFAPSYEGAVILEILTPRLDNAKHYKSYLEHLKS